MQNNPEDYDSIKKKKLEISKCITTTKIKYCFRKVQFQVYTHYYVHTTDCEVLLTVDHGAKSFQTFFALINLTVNRNESLVSLM